MSTSAFPWGCIAAAGEGGFEPSYGNRTVTDGAIDPADAQVRHEFSSDGSARQYRNGAYETAGRWLSAFGTPGDWEIRFTAVSGTPTSGAALNTWLSMSSSWDQRVIQSIVGSKTFQYTVEFRNATTLAVVASATITLSAIVDP